MVALKINRLSSFLVNSKYMSSCDLKILNFRLCCALVKIMLFSTHSMKYIRYSPQKSKYPLSISRHVPLSGHDDVALFELHRQ